MKFSALIIRFIMLIYGVICLALGVFLYVKYGFVDSDKFEIIYGVIASQVVLSIILVVYDLCSPKIYIDDTKKTLYTIGVYDERRKYKKGIKYNVKYAYVTISLDEIAGCTIVKKQVRLQMKDNNNKILYATGFTKKQLENLKYEIDKRINNTANN